ncbi:MAG: phosphopantetheine-binding protein [Deltaproteobacteria bacterium]|nr:phosphopantetheine-binding protein [Deltaproteobacteria bacterium]
MQLEDLEAELKDLIVEALMLKDVKPAQINSTEPLFVEGLGLDSIDALELGLAIEGKWGFKIGGDEASARKAFASVRSLAAFIHDKISTQPALSAAPTPAST